MTNFHKVVIITSFKDRAMSKLLFTYGQLRNVCVCLVLLFSYDASDGIFLKCSWNREYFVSSAKLSCVGIHVNFARNPKHS